MLRRALACILVMTPLAAAAQTVIVQRPPLPGTIDGRSDIVRVQVQMNFFVSGPVDDSDPSIQAQEHARRAIYDAAGRECEVLRASIANDCRLEAITVGINRQWAQAQKEGFQANGNLTYRVTLK